MEMTVVVTRNAPDRVRGFLASCMCEVAPGVYTGPGMSHGVRTRVWAVLDDWWPHFPESSVLMTWPDKKAVGGQQFWVLGAPKVVLHEQDGMFLVRGEMTQESWRSLKTEEP